jgi:hypothetical protein
MHMYRAHDEKVLLGFHVQEEMGLGGSHFLLHSLVTTDIDVFSFQHIGIIDNN